MFPFCWPKPPDEPNPPDEPPKPPPPPKLDPFDEPKLLEPPNPVVDEEPNVEAPLDDVFVALDAPDDAPNNAGADEIAVGGAATVVAGLTALFCDAAAASAAVG